MRLPRLVARVPPAFWWSLLAYTAVTAWQGRDVLANLGSTVIHDAGDPLLNATILVWNARHVPLTQAWWNLPIFAPTPDALTFSEHLLGLAPISTPLYWLTGSGLVAYNLTTLLTYPLCGAAMFALVQFLTGSGSASFLAGLAFAFAHYRVSHLPHVQVLGAFWMPLALLGLHRYVSEGGRRWLLLFAAAWLLQGAANGYYLVFFSVLAGLWVLWFVLVRRRWRTLWPLAGVTAVAAVPLVPILHRYVAVHDAYGFTRTRPEVEFYSADVAAVLCAPHLLTFWAWLKIACKPEGELFPGITIVLVVVAAVLFLWSPAVALPRDRRVRIAALIAFAVAGAYLVTALSVWWFGRWRIELGPAAVSASSFRRPFAVALWAAAIGFAATARFGRLAVSSTGAFYALAAVVTWMLALGPVPRLAHERALDVAPYSWLMTLPGADGLRVPARFWMITVLCLAILMGLLAGRAASLMRPALVRVLTPVLAAGILIDSWTQIPVVLGPDMLWSERLSRSTVLELPVGEVDTFAGLRAAEGGWETVNGYSGYRPPSYDVVRAALRADDGSLLPYLTSPGPLNVIVLKDARRMLEMLQRETRATPVAETADRILYRVRQEQPEVRRGGRVAIARIAPSCSRDIAPMLIDGAIDIAWDCGPQLSDEELLVDLATVSTVGAIRLVGGQRPSDHPRELVVESSEDGKTWQRAWTGGVAGLVFQAAVTTPRYVPIVLTFEPRPARFIRLRQIGRDSRAVWAVSEVEVYEPAESLR
jgi:hypothetical protein